MSAFQSIAEYDLTTLRAEIAGYQALIAVLHQEQDALRRADADALPNLVAVKHRHVQALNDFAGGRVRVLSNAGVAVRRAAAEALLVQQGADPALVTKAWQQLEHLINDAQRLNALNGVLIEAQQTYFSRALAALSRAAGATPSYGPDGRPQFGPESRAIAAI